MFWPRRMIPLIQRALNRQAAVALIGPRQVGKTTLAHFIVDNQNALYLDLESNVDRSKLADPALFLGEYENRLVVLDEIHRVPEIFPELRSLIDQGRRRGIRNNRFLVLGSASMDVLQQTSESLAGRVEILAVNPFDVLEVTTPVPRKISGTKTLWVRGGFPDSFLSSTDADSLAFRDQFIRTYIERDIPQMGIRIPSERVGRFLTMLAHSQGALLNASRLASSLDVSATTVFNYIDIFVKLLMIRRLPPFHVNGIKRLVKSPKVFIRDSGLVHALLSLEDFNELVGHPVVGPSWEGFVIENLLAVAPPRARASFYRTAAGAEIDLILELPGQPGVWAIEIKHSLAPKLSRGFHSARADLNPVRSFVVYAGEERYPIAKDVEVIGVRAMALLLNSLWQRDWIGLGSP